MKPYYQEDGISIYHGNCNLVLPLLGECVDVLLTSPPYNVGLKYLSYSDSLSELEFRSFTYNWLASVIAALKESARAYIIVGDRMLWLKEAAEMGGLTFGQMLAWCKPNLAGGSGKISNDWNYLAEWILLFRKGKRTAMLNGQGANTHSFFVIPAPQTNWSEEEKQHPAQWPEELPKRLLSRTPGDVVLDPFMGSGTALVAAKDLGRKAIGIEIEEKYCEIAAKRLSQKVLDFK